MSSDQNLIVNLTVNPPFFTILGPIRETTIEKLNTVLPTVCTTVATENTKFAFEYKENPPHWEGSLATQFVDEEVGQAMLIIALMDALEEEGGWKLKGSDATMHDTDKPHFPVVPESFLDSYSIATDAWERRNLARHELRVAEDQLAAQQRQLAAADAQRTLIERRELLRKELVDWARTEDERAEELQKARPPSATHREREADRGEKKCETVVAAPTESRPPSASSCSGGLNGHGSLFPGLWVLPSTGIEELDRFCRPFLAGDAVTQFDAAVVLFKKKDFIAAAKLLEALSLSGSTTVDVKVLPAGVRPTAGVLAVSALLLANSALCLYNARRYVEALSLLSPTLESGEAATKRSGLGLYVTLRSAAAVFDLVKARKALCILKPLASQDAALSDAIAGASGILDDIGRYRDALRRGQPDESLKYIERVILAHGIGKDFVFELARIDCLMSLPRRVEEAECLVRDLLILYPREPDLLLRYAQLQLFTRNEGTEILAAADRLLEQAIATPAGASSVKIRTTQRFVHALGQAVAAAKDAIAAATSASMFYRAYEKLTALASGHLADPSLVTGVMSGRMGDEALMWAELSRALAHSSFATSTITTEALRCLLKAGKFKEVLEECTRLNCSEAENDFGVRIGRAVLAALTAQAHIGLGNYKEAFKAAHIVLVESPSDESREFLRYAESFLKKERPSGATKGASTGKHPPPKGTSFFPRRSFAESSSSSSSASASPPRARGKQFPNRNHMPNVQLNTARDKHCRILGVTASATRAEISRAFKAEALRWHPDKWVNASDRQRQCAEEHFKEVNNAYSTLNERT